MKQNHIFNWYTVLWSTALLIVALLYFGWRVDKKYIGIVDRKTHLIGCREPGRIHSLLVQVGDRVQSGQVLAVMDISDLKMQLSLLRGELAQIEDLADAQHKQYYLEVKRLKIQLDNEALELIDRVSLLESKSVELESINKLIARFESAEQAGLGYNSDLADLIIRRDALKAYLMQQNHLNVSGIGDVEELHDQRKKWLKEIEYDSMSHARMLEMLEHTEEIRRQIAMTEHRIHLRTMIAPCDGYIIELHAGTGDVVDQFVPLVTIEESPARYLTAYLPEKSVINPEIGSSVKIYSNRQKKQPIYGTITFVHPGFSLADERLSFRGRVFWARKILVEIAPENSLIPGEFVYVRFPGSARNARLASRRMDNGDPEKPDLLYHDMNIPSQLQARSRCEPSGICWSPQLEKFILVSDDTGLENSPSEHIPWLFLMDGNGVVDPEPLPIADLASVNDLEAITAVSESVYYLASSQNISKQGKRPASREQLLKIQITDTGAKLLSRVNLLTLLEDVYGPDSLLALGLGQYESDGKPKINIEGLLYKDAALYIGLKEPITKSGALIWKLNDPELLFQTGRLSAGQLRLWSKLPLKINGESERGISDMTLDDKGCLWILSTIPGATVDRQMGALYRVKNFPDIPPEIRCFRTFPGMKPEGLCFPENGQMLVVFDNDENTPQFCYLNPEKMR